MALLNADKFFGRDITYRHLPAYQKMVHCAPKHGTYTSDMSNVLGRASRRSWKTTKKFLHGHCLIIQTGDGKRGRKGHYSLICMDRQGDYFLVNHYKAAYAAVAVSWQKVYWLWRKAHRVWYVNEPILETNDEA